MHQPLAVKSQSEAVCAHQMAMMRDRPEMGKHLHCRTSSLKETEQIKYIILFKKATAYFLRKTAQNGSKGKPCSKHLRMLFPFAPPAASFCAKECRRRCVKIKKRTPP